MYTSSDSFLFEYFQYSFLRDQGYGKYDTIQRADLRISDIGNLVGSDWVNLAHELDISDSDINIVKSEYPDSDGKLNQIQNYEFCMKYKEYPVINYIYYSLVSGQQAIVMLRLWQSTQGNQATGNVLESALKQIGREDIVNKCMFNVEQVTDEMERLTAKEVLEDVSGFDAFKV